MQLLISRLCASITQKWSSIHCQTTCSRNLKTYPCVIRAGDAAQTGMGGVLFTKGKHLIMRHATFPEDIQQCIMTTDNPGGDLTNSNLEQAGVLTQANVANNLYDLCNHALSTLNDNIAAISCNCKGALTSNHVLCHLTSLHQQHHRYCHEVSRIKGKAN